MSGVESSEPGEDALSGTAAELRLVQRAPLPPAALGALVALVLFGAYLALCAVFGAPILHGGRGFGHFVWIHARTILLLSVLMGYLTAALSWESSARRRDLVALGVLEPEALLLVPEAVLRRSRWVGAAGALAGLALVASLMATYGGRVGASAWDVPATPWTAVVLPTLFWLIARTAYFVLQSLRDVAPPEAIDLLALERLRPAGRVALRGSLFWLVGLSIAAVLFFTPDLTLLVLPFFGATTLVAAATLLLPARGVQRAIHRAKTRELERVDGLLAGVRDEALRGDATAQARLGGLVAWRNHVERLPEWPFDTSTWLRFALYLLIPLGSWVAGALVERGLDVLLAGR